MRLLLIFPAEIVVIELFMWAVVVKEASLRAVEFIS